MKRFLVTGGAGFIGSNLVRELSKLDLYPIVFDNFSTGSIENISDIIDSVEIIHGDILDEQLINDIASRVDGIFHLAALVSVPLSINKPGLSFDINARGTKIIIDAARKAGGKKVVMASSAAVYGNNIRVPLTEDAELNPLSPYGLDKLIGEELGSMYAKLYDMDIIALRFFNVFGPNQNPSSPYSGVISIFMDRILRGEAPIIYGDGKQTRDFIYVADVVRALVLSMGSTLRGFHVYNTSRGEGISINSIWDILCSTIGSTIRPVYKPERKGDIKFSNGDISIIRDELRFQPSITIEEGLLSTYEWARSHMLSFIK